MITHSKPEPLKYVYLETTNFCNLNCRFCNRRDVVKKPVHMPLERWEIILKKLSAQPVAEAKLMGLGEPFLHPQFHTICRRFKETFPKAFTIVATNCQYALNDNFVKALPHISLLYLSVDGYGKNYERDRAGAAWSRVTKFLDDLSHVDRSTARITINYVVNHENYQDIAKIHEMVNEKYPFIEEIRLNIAQWWGGDEDVSIPLSAGLLAELVKYKKNVKGKAPWTFSDCFWPRGGLYMDVYGNVKICCLNTSAAAIGNLFTHSLEQIMNAPGRLQIARECAINWPGAHCGKCSYKRLSPVLEMIFNSGRPDLPSMSAIKSGVL